MYDIHTISDRNKKDSFKRILFDFLPRNCEKMSAITSKDDHTIDEMLNIITISQEGIENLIFKDLKNIFFNSISINDFSERFIRNLHQIWININSKFPTDAKDKKIIKENVYNIYSDFITAFANAILVEFIQSLRISDLAIYSGLIEHGSKSFQKEEDYKEKVTLEIEHNNFFINLVRLSNYINDKEKHGTVNEINTIKEIIKKSIAIISLPIWREILQKSYNLELIFIAKPQDNYQIIFCKDKDIVTKFKKARKNINPTEEWFHQEIYRKILKERIVKKSNNFNTIEAKKDAS
jgi:hypothetical protein